MSDQIDLALEALRREYLSSVPAKLEELRADLAALEQGSPEAGGSLRERFHRLAGSGGSFGFAELSAIAREAERWLADQRRPENADGLLPILERLEAAAQAAEARFAAPSGGEKGAVVPRARIIMRATPQRERIAQELRAAGYEVQFGARLDDPGATPIEQFPHLLVIGGEAGDGDLSAIASAWTSDPARRPGAVVLVETLRPVDRLRAIAAGVDAVFPAEQVEQKLPRYARTFARIGPPPSSVLLVDHDASLAARIVPALEQAHIRVVRCLPPQNVLEVLERELPDLLLLNTRLVSSDPFAVARMARQDPRFSLLPIVFLGEETSSTRIASLRAGADDFLADTAEPALLVQVVIARSSRGRRLRELVLRDNLTGLLNHATLMNELENAVDYSRHYGEPLAFILLELEGFKRMSERMGPKACDEVLLHVATVFRSNVRASDVIGRYGGEAFGILLRGANTSGATVMAQNLQNVLQEQPARTSGGEVVPLAINVGAAFFPKDGMTAAELARVAGKRVSGASA